MAARKKATGIEARLAGALERHFGDVLESAIDFAFAGAQAALIGPPRGPMTADQAYQLLDISPGCTEPELYDALVRKARQQFGPLYEAYMRIKGEGFGPG